MIHRSFLQIMIWMKFLLIWGVTVNGQEFTIQAERFSQNGYARLNMADQSFYIDSLGQKAFDSYEGEDRILMGDPTLCKSYLDFMQRYPNRLPRPVIVVTKDAKMGVLSPLGEWLLPADYEQVDVRYEDFWKVTKEGKQSYYGVNGQLLPFQEEVGYLDGRYFDVKMGDHWGIYDCETKKMVLPAVYEAFDYCGGCGLKSDYVYAKYQGKWGIIGFDGVVKIPFDYEHTHNGMRSDEWVDSFAKDGKSVVLHIPTGRVFTSGAKASLEILTGGELVYELNGKYGLLNRQAKEMLPALYDAIEQPNQNYYLGYQGPYTIVKQHNRKGVYQQGKGLIVAPEWEDVMVYDDYFALKKDGYWGLYDTLGNILLTNRYTEITHINDYFYSAGSGGIKVFKTKQKTLHGLYFVETKKEVQPQFYTVELASTESGEAPSLIEGEYKDEYAVYNINGEEYLPLGYESWSFLDSTSTRFLRVEKSKRCGIYDRIRQQEVIPLYFDDFSSIAGTNDMILTMTGDYGNYHYGLYALDGKEVAPAHYRAFEILMSGSVILSGEENGEKACLFDSKGRATVLPARYARAVGADHLLLLSDDSVKGHLYQLQQASVISEMTFRFVDTYAEEGGTSIQKFTPQGLAWVRVDGQYGLLDTLGQWAIPPSYDRVLDFGTKGVSVAAKYAEKDGQHWTELLEYIFVAADGKPLSDEKSICPTDFLMDMDYFLEDKLIIRKIGEEGNLEMGLMDLQGKVLVAPMYDQIESFNRGAYFLFAKDEHFGIADATGHILLPCVFQNLLFDRYNKESGLTFPILGYKKDAWHYYKSNGEQMFLEAWPEIPLTVQLGWF